MTDIGPGEYWGSDYLLQAQRRPHARRPHAGFARMRTCPEDYYRAAPLHEPREIRSRVRQCARGIAHVVSADLDSYCGLPPLQPGHGSSASCIDALRAPTP